MGRRARRTFRHFSTILTVNLSTLRNLSTSSIETIELVPPGNAEDHRDDDRVVLEVPCNLAEETVVVCKLRFHLSLNCEPFIDNEIALAVAAFFV